MALAINELGAACVPINLAYRGRLPEHVVRDSGARLMVASAALVERLSVLSESPSERAALTDVVALGGSAPPQPGLRNCARSASACGPAQPVQPASLMNATAAPSVSSKIA